MSDNFHVPRKNGARRQARVGKVTEERAVHILDAIRRWHLVHGEPPTLADWEPSRARASGQLWKAQRWEEGDWPSVRMSVSTSAR